MRVGSFHSAQWAEANDLQRTLAHWLSILKILWYAKPDEVKFEDMSDWITVIKDEVRTKLKAVAMFIWDGGMRLPTEHNADDGVMPQDMEMEADTDIGLSIRS